MAAVTQRVSNYLGGVSKQSDDKKLPGQVTELINGYPDVTIGLTKRPGFKFIATLKNASGTAYSSTSLDGARWFYINRDTDTEKYIGCITPKVDNVNGTILVWNAITGDPCTVNTTTHHSAWATNTEYAVGDRVLSDNGKVYECIIPGTTAGTTAPAGTGTSIADVVASIVRSDSMTYSIGDVVSYAFTTDSSDHYNQGGSGESHNKLYKCSQAGTVIANYDEGQLKANPSGTNVQWGVGSNPITKWDFFCHTVHWKYVYNITDYFNGTRNNYDVLTVQDTSIITNNNVTATAEATPTKPWLRTRQTLLYNDAAIHTNNYHLMGPLAPHTNDAVTTAGGKWTFKFHRNDGTTAVRSGIHITRATQIGGTNDMEFNNSVTLTQFLSTMGDRILSESIKKDIGFGNSPETDYHGYGCLNFVVVNNTIQLDCTADKADPDNSERRYFAVEVLNDDIPVTMASNLVDGYGQDVPVLKAPYAASTQLVTTFEENAATVASLPATSFHNHIWHVSNSASLDEEKYWVKFKADDEVQTAISSGYWVETIDPNVFPGLVEHTMPHELVNTAANTFTFRPITFTKRLAGDDLTNPAPSFIDKKIEKTFYHSNRLGFLAGDNVILSQNGEPFNFFYITARKLTHDDPIDLACQTTRPTSLKNVLPTAGGLILFSKNQQFIMLSENDGVLSPLTASTKAISNFELDTSVEPVDFGSYFNFLTKTPGQTRVFSMVFQGKEDPPKSLDISTVVGTWIPTTIDNFVASVQSQLLALSSQSSRDIYAFRTYNDGEKPIMQSWFKWQLPGTVQHINIDNDDFYAITKQGGNWTISLANLTQSPDDAIIVNNNGDKINPCMDLYKAATEVRYKSVESITITAGGSGYTSAPTVTFSAAPEAANTATGTAVISNGAVTGITMTKRGSGYTAAPTISFSGGGGSNAAATSTINSNDLSRCYLPFTDDTNLNPVIVVAGDTSGGTYTESGFTITPTRGSDSAGSYFSVPGKDLATVASNVIVGYRYDFDVTLPKTYFYDGNQRSDYTASLTLARMKFAVGLSGMMGFKLKIKGRNEWYSINPVVTADNYLADDVPLDEHSVFTVPIHQRTENTEVRLFNDSPFPVSLNSMMWEGNYSPRFYRRT